MTNSGLECWDEERIPPGGTDAARGRRRKVLPVALMLTDSSEQLSWPLSRYASKHVTFIHRDHWNLPEGDYACLLTADASVDLLAQVHADNERPAAIRMEALAIREAAASTCLIERKSLPDFVSTVTVGHDRFADECERSRVYGRFVIIVEADPHQIRDYCEGRGTKYRSVMGAAHFLFARGFPIYWAGDRVTAAAAAYRIMECWARDRAHGKASS